MKWSFYEFSELINEHKLTEAKDGEHLERLKKNMWQSPTDLQMGRGSQRPEVQDTEQGAALQKAVNNQNWDQAVTNNPDLAYLGQAAKELRAQDAKDRQAEEERTGGASYIRRGGKVVGSTNQETRLEKALKGDLSPEGQMALKINDFIYSNPEEFADKNLTGLQWAELISQHMPKGGTQTDRDWKTSVMRGFAKLNKLSGSTLLTPNENSPGTYEMNVDVLADRGSRGIDSMGDHRNKHGDTLMNALEQDFEKVYGQFMSLQRKKGNDDPKTIKAAKRLVDLGNTIKHRTGARGQSFANIADKYNQALDISNKPADLSDFY